MLQRVRIAVDCMGGDLGPAATLPACQAFLSSHPHAELLLVGRPETVGVARHWPRCTVIEANEVVAMDDPVEVALRRKKDSSLRVAINQLKAADGIPAAADACVSSGNTGALMAVARFVLKTMEGIDRPAIATVLPNRKGTGTTVLDLGANVDCGPDHLLQFAIMGSALVTAVTENPSPTVGLLNVGEEVIKGSEVIKKTGELLRGAHEAGLVNFHGNVEGNDIFKGTTDIVVCDGFVGNVALKAAEGLASMVGEQLKAEFSAGWLSKAAAVVALPVLKRFKQRVDHRRFNGAALLGLRGLVFKSHGSADAYAFERALERAYEAARHQLLSGVQSRVTAAVSNLPASAAQPA
ncbi:phosphate acyltransferase PlsX [Inhella gelatinilytica]|uniref:Phosphate acyltransferase n=1 Tax=Inhella gelatinilytica TaxID=2795030 RepID=A0A931IYB0_9BURK|nr:phosphate acyltransferase PlsX [Inhella gelatinilytica]MBH9553304.1 phosphate acyltransferase PlsX [Inhella gelatinilytica]